MAQLKRKTKHALCLLAAMRSIDKLLKQSTKGVKRTELLNRKIDILIAYIDALTGEVN